MRRPKCARLGFTPQVVRLKRASPSAPSVITTRLKKLKPKLKTPRLPNPEFVNKQNDAATARNARERREKAAKLEGDQKLAKSKRIAVGEGLDKKIEALALLNSLNVVGQIV